MTRTASYPDADARCAIAEDLDTTLVVEAAAGTGKTTELVNRILRVLATGRAKMDEIVAVTFTEKAAGELKLRLRESLERARADATNDDERDRLELALAKLEEAHVNTIHGFCAELLRERPVEAGVDPLFTVLTAAQADRLYARAFQTWLQETLKNPPDGVRRALARTSFGPDRDGPIDRLRNAGRTLAEWRQFPQAWARPAFDRAAALDDVVAQLHRLADVTSAPSYERDSLYIDTAAVRRLSRQIRLEASFGQRNLEAWEARLIDLGRDRGITRTRKGSGARFGKDVSRTEVLAARDTLYGALLQFRRDADADLAAALQHELAGATAGYQELKAAAGALDFTDLLARARDLIRDDEPVRTHLQKKFVRIFVDEFQDTDPIQAEILLLLADNAPGKLFIVGDPKQAIYRFRGTDVGTYWDVSRELAANGGRVLQLTTSYRSVPAIQRFVNAAFSQEMTADERTLQAGYVPLSPFRDPNDAQPAVVALPVPTPYGRSAYVRVSAKAIEESLPDAVGGFIEWLLESSGWTIDGKPIQPRDIAILFRRFVNFGEDVTRRYIDAIEARGIAHLLIGGKAFHGREEVETIRAALAAIEWPDDELSVFSTLKGSLFAIDDEHLLEFRHRFGMFHPFRVPKELGGNSGADLVLTGEPTAQLMPIALALRLLQQLHRGRNHRPVADTIGRLLAETRAHVGFILRPAGEQALANVLHVAELARQYEAGGGISFRGFIDELRAAADATEAAEAPILEEGSDGVRLMTVHKAKGLEFPVVILADMTCHMSRNEASRYLHASSGLCAMKIGGWAPHELHEHETDEVDRDRAEGVRLAYVAATRARDLLVVPTLGDEPWDAGWFSPLNRALYPPLADRRSAMRGPKCPAFKSKDSVLERPNNEAAGAATVCPGQHAFPDAGGFPVVWWDPSALSLGAKPTFGVRRSELIVKDVPKHVVADGRSRYDRWQLARHDARARGATPSLRVETAHEWAVAGEGSRVVGAPADVQIVDLRQTDAGDRSGGVGFGLLVHGVLARAPFGAEQGMIVDLAAVEGRALGLSDDDVRAAAAAVRRLLAHDLLVRASAADARGECRRETPVTYIEDAAAGVLIDGVVDLAFEEDGRWIVIDYKTDREIIASGEERYRRQVGLYATAIAQTTGKPASGILVRI
jgi:ATP-dependent exoDNAse (exonuclease V) beta subunit